jgi:RNA polymerase sigma-70 factor (ECF subfamily)
VATKKRHFNSEYADRFVRLLMANHHKIYTYIFTLLPHHGDADDVMQETTSVMLQHFEDFQEGTNFTAWGKKIAFYEILKYRREQRNLPQVFEDERTFRQIADYMEHNNDTIDRRIDALQDCIEKLDQKDKKIVVLRYQKDRTMQHVAEACGVHLATVYRAFERIHYILAGCVRKALAAE